jgi:RimJ/RimL family protein N-acetyltransferase
MRYTKDNSLAGLEAARGVIIGSKVRLREKKLSDARNDHGWQSDPELARLDAAPVLSVAFPVYLLDYFSQLHDSGLKRYPLAVETLDGKHIGNCTCYDINAARGEAQLGIMIGDRNYWDKGYGTDAVSTMVSHIFLNTKLGRIYLKTLDWNLRAQKCFQHCGFTPCGHLNRDGNKFVLMEIRREQWQKQRDERQQRAEDKLSTNRMA